jgi:hypothetical protein
MEDTQCWICFEGNGVKACACPRHVHPACLATWQAMRAGTDEETVCRFCNQDLPDWKPILAPPSLIKTHHPVFTVTIGGVSKRVSVPLGANAQPLFVQQLRTAFGIDPMKELDISFDCTLPIPPRNKLVFHGWETFDAALTLASCQAKSPTARDAANAWPVVLPGSV